MTAPRAGAREVHAVLAAGVENPALIARWRAEPALLRDHGLEPGEVDLDALWKFAGLTTKVRHNGLRDDFPLTFRVMSAAGIEIDLFAAYAGERAARSARLAPTTAQRVIELMAFLERWLDRAQPSHGVVWDVIRHEHALAELARTPPSPAEPGLPDAAVAARATARSIARVRGRIILHEMTCDPRAIADALANRTSGLAGLARAPSYLCYWRGDTAPAEAPEAAPAIAIVQLDELGYYALTLIDGQRSAAALHRAFGLTGKTGPAVLGALDQLAGLGMIALGGPARGGRRA